MSSPIDHMDQSDSASVVDFYHDEEDSHIQQDNYTEHPEDDPTHDNSHNNLNDSSLSDDLPSFDPNSTSSLNSPYHKIALLICPLCKFIEFPGCGTHKQLLSCPRDTGNHMSCRSCSIEDRNSERDEIVSTDLSTPWCEACRHCRGIKADVHIGLITNAEVKRIESIVDKLPGEEHTFQTHLISCNQCKTIQFALNKTGDEFLLNFNSNSTTEKAIHCTPYCTGETRLIQVLLSKSESSYLVSTLNKTPYLRLPASQIKQKLENKYKKRSNNSESQIENKSNEEVIRIPKTEALHCGIVCDNIHCNKHPITGVRYRCSVCSDFDLCGNCAEKPFSELEFKTRAQHHESHPLIRYNKAVQAGLQLLDANNRSINSQSGFDRNLFLTDEPYLEELIESLLCSICLDICKDAKSTDCGHNYCSSCLSKSMLLRLECPLDRLPLSSNFLKETSVLDKDLRETIQSLRVKCMNAEAGCEWNGQLNQLFVHLKQECNWKECEFAKFGCTFKVEKNTASTASTSSSSTDHHNHLQLVYQQLSELTENTHKVSETVSDNYRSLLFPVAQRQANLTNSVQYLYSQFQQLVTENHRKEEQKTNELNQLTTTIRTVHDENLQQLRQEIIQTKQNVEKWKSVISIVGIVTAGIGIFAAIKLLPKTSSKSPSSSSSSSSNIQIRRS